MSERVIARKQRCCDIGGCEEIAATTCSACRKDACRNHGVLIRVQVLRPEPKRAGQKPTGEWGFKIADAFEAEFCFGHANQAKRIFRSPAKIADVKEGAA